MGFLLFSSRLLPYFGSQACYGCAFQCKAVSREDAAWSASSRELAGAAAARNLDSPSLHRGYAGWLRGESQTDATAVTTAAAMQRSAIEALVGRKRTEPRFHFVASRLRWLAQERVAN